MTKARDISLQIMRTHIIPIYRAQRKYNLPRTFEAAVLHKYAALHTCMYVGMRSTRWFASLVSPLHTHENHIV